MLLINCGKVASVLHDGATSETLCPRRYARLIFSPCLNDLPEKYSMSELFAGFSHHVWVNLLRHGAVFRLKI